MKRYFKSRVLLPRTRQNCNNRVDFQILPQSTWLVYDWSFPKFYEVLSSKTYLWLTVHDDVCGQVWHVAHSSYDLTRRKLQQTDFPAKSDLDFIRMLRGNSQHFPRFFRHKRTTWNSSYLFSVPFIANSFREWTNSLRKWANLSRKSDQKIYMLSSIIKHRKSTE